MFAGPLRYLSWWIPLLLGHRQALVDGGLIKPVPFLVFPTVPGRRALFPLPGPIACQQCPQQGEGPSAPRCREVHKNACLLRHKPERIPADGGAGTKSPVWTSHCSVDGTVVPEWWGCGTHYYCQNTPQLCLIQHTEHPSSSFMGCETRWKVGGQPNGHFMSCRYCADVVGIVFSTGQWIRGHVGGRAVPPAHLSFLASHHNLNLVSAHAGTDLSASGPGVERNETERNGMGWGPLGLSHR